MQLEKKIFPTYHIFLPSDISKEAFIHWTDNVGKRHRIRGGINKLKTIEERRLAAEKIIQELKRDWKPIMPLGLKMIGWAAEREGNWRKKTYQTIRSRIDCLIRFVDGKEITNDLMKAFFSDLTKRRHARTCEEYYIEFRCIFKALKKLELLEGIDLPKSISTPAKYFQSHQVQKIKKHLLPSDPQLWLACEFQYYTFIRPGELRLVRVGDIHFDEWKICVRALISKNKKEQYVTIPLAFRAQIEALKDRNANEFIFYNKDVTTPLPVNQMQKRFREVLKKLGFGLEYQFYSWKHTGAVAAVRAGISLKELQIQLRHYSLEEVDQYIRQLGVHDLEDLEGKFPAI
jgi:integrase